MFIILPPGYLNPPLFSPVYIVFSFNLPITPISSCWAYFKTDKQQYHTALIGECNTSTHTHTHTDNIHKYHFIYSKTHLEYLMVRSWVFCLIRLLIWAPAEVGRYLWATFDFASVYHLPVIINLLISLQLFILLLYFDNSFNSSF